MKYLKLFEDLVPYKHITYEEACNMEIDKNREDWEFIEIDMLKERFEIDKLDTYYHNVDITGNRFYISKNNDVVSDFLKNENIECVEIHKYVDEWFLLCYKIAKHSRGGKIYDHHTTYKYGYFYCDQFHGLMQCLKDNQII